uniref:Reverse transcriptase domain-containing protein n=1 Tax=Macrostomum lignano TaxID=282301 RepID=A0A1I8I929_9PLAT
PNVRQDALVGVNLVQRVHHGFKALNAAVLADLAALADVAGLALLVNGEQAAQDDVTWQGQLSLAVQQSETDAGRPDSAGAAAAAAEKDQSSPAEAGCGAHLHFFSSLSAPVQKGGPQGGVLTPVLWNMVMDELLCSDLHDPILKVGYADDVTAICAGPSVDTIRDLLQGFLGRAERWANQCGLRLSESKTTAVMFTNKLLWTIKPLTLYGKNISMEKQVRCLGLTLDHRLNWTPHIQTKAKKALAVLAQIRRAVGTTWGLTPRKLWWIYTAIIRPSISYASLVWASGLSVKSNLDALYKIQGRACRMTMGAPPSTPFEGMNAFLCAPPLDIYIKGEAAKSTRRLLDAGVAFKKVRAFKKRSLIPHSDLCLKALEECGGLNILTDSIPATLLLSQRYKVTIQPRHEASDSWSDSEVHCYTDGSMRHGLSGFGACVFFKGEVVWSYSQHTGLNSSVFQSEVLAISSCAAELRRRQLSGRKFIFHSDSQAALRALCRSTASSRSVLDCNTQLNGLALGNQVELRWIPGHAGFLGNERADLLAKAGSAGALLGRAREPPSPPRLNRRDLRAVSMALSGHGCFSRHRFLQGQVPEERCPFCRSGSENAEHFICHCPVFTRARLTHLGPNPVLSDVCRPESIPLLARYLRDTGRADFFPTVGGPRCRRDRRVPLSDITSTEVIGRQGLAEWAVSSASSLHPPDAPGPLQLSQSPDGRPKTGQSPGVSKPSFYTGAVIQCRVGHSLHVVADLEGGAQPSGPRSRGAVQLLTTRKLRRPSISTSAQNRSLDVVQHAEHDGPLRLRTAGREGEIVGVAKHAEPPLRLTSTHASPRNKSDIFVRLVSQYIAIMRRSQLLWHVVRTEHLWEHRLDDRVECLLGIYEDDNQDPLACLCFLDDSVKSQDLRHCAAMGPEAVRLRTQHPVEQLRSAGLKADASMLLKPCGARLLRNCDDLRRGPFVGCLLAEKHAIHHSGDDLAGHTVDAQRLVGHLVRTQRFPARLKLSSAGNGISGGSVRLSGGGGWRRVDNGGEERPQSRLPGLAKCAAFAPIGPSGRDGPNGVINSSLLALQTDSRQGLLCLVGWSPAQTESPALPSLAESRGRLAIPAAPAGPVASAGLLVPRRLDAAHTSAYSAPPRLPCPASLGSPPALRCCRSHAPQTVSQVDFDNIVLFVFSQSLSFFPDMVHDGLRNRRSQYVCSLRMGDPKLARAPEFLNLVGANDLIQTTLTSARSTNSVLMKRPHTTHMEQEECYCYSRAEPSRRAAVRAQVSRRSTADNAEAPSPVYQHLGKNRSLDVVQHAEHDGPLRLRTAGREGEIVGVAKHAEPPLRLTSTHASPRNKSDIFVRLVSQYIAIMRRSQLLWHVVRTEHLWEHRLDDRVECLLGIYEDDNQDPLACLCFLDDSVKSQDLRHCAAMGPEAVRLRTQHPVEQLRSAGLKADASMLLKPCGARLLRNCDDLRRGPFVGCLLAEKHAIHHSGDDLAGHTVDAQRLVGHLVRTQRFPARLKLSSAGNGISGGSVRLSGGGGWRRVDNGGEERPQSRLPGLAKCAAFAPSEPSGPAAETARMASSTAACWRCRQTAAKASSASWVGRLLKRSLQLFPRLPNRGVVLPSRLLPLGRSHQRDCLFRGGSNCSAHLRVLGTSTLAMSCLSRKPSSAPVLPFSRGLWCPPPLLTAHPVPSGDKKSHFLHHGRSRCRTDRRTTLTGPTPLPVGWQEARTRRTGERSGREAGCRTRSSRGDREMQRQLCWSSASLVRRPDLHTPSTHTGSNPVQCGHSDTSQQTCGRLSRLPPCQAQVCIGPNIVALLAVSQARSTAGSDGFNHRLPQLSPLAVRQRFGLEDSLHQTEGHPGKSSVPLEIDEEKLSLSDMPDELFKKVRRSVGLIGNSQKGDPYHGSEKRSRREIANCNERRRMQSINSGFESLKTLLPTEDGEKLSKQQEQNPNQSQSIAVSSEHRPCSTEAARCLLQQQQPQPAVMISPFTPQDTSQPADRQQQQQQQPIDDEDAAEKDSNLSLSSQRLVVVDLAAAAAAAAVESSPHSAAGSSDPDSPGQCRPRAIPHKYLHRPQVVQANREIRSFDRSRGRRRGVAAVGHDADPGNGLHGRLHIVDPTWAVLDEHEDLRWNHTVKIAPRQQATLTLEPKTITKVVMEQTQMQIAVSRTLSSRLDLGSVKGVVDADPNFLGIVQRLHVNGASFPGEENSENEQKSCSFECVNSLGTSAGGPARIGQVTINGQPLTGRGRAVGASRQALRKFTDTEPTASRMPTADTLITAVRLPLLIDSSLRITRGASTGGAPSGVQNRAYLASRPNVSLHNAGVEHEVVELDGAIEALRPLPVRAGLRQVQVGVGKAELNPHVLRAVGAKLMDLWNYLPAFILRR